MNKLHRKQWILTAAAVIVFASASLAQTTLNLTGVGDGYPVYNSSGQGVYVDPYVGTIGNSTTSVYMICDDWSDNSSTGTSWQANLSTIGPSLTGSPLFAASAGSGAQALYNEVAWLGSQLLNPANVTNGPTQAAISFAIWELTFPYYPTATNGTPADTSDPFAFLSSNSANSSIYTAAQTYLCEAKGGCQGYAGEANYDAAGWSVFTPTSANNTEPQEFLVYTPESSSGILMAADMFGLLGLAIVFRRRLLRAAL